MDRFYRIVQLLGRPPKVTQPQEVLLVLIRQRAWQQLEEEILRKEEQVS